MATLALSAAGAAIGSAVLPGVGVLGATISGAAIGQAAGALAGSFIDQALFGASGQSRVVAGPRLSDLQLMTSSEGAAIPRVYGRVRLSGQVIWATRFEEEAVRIRESQASQSGGKGLGGATGSAATDGEITRIEYRYFANFAVGLCEGPVTRIGRVWADGKPINLARFTWRLHKGEDTQDPDSLIEAKLGAGLAPAYRGLAYVVFERMPLARFGNRLPQLSFEIFRAVDGFEKLIRSVTLIPGAGEFAYEPDEITRDVSPGVTAPENTHSFEGGSDWDAAIGDLEASLPNVERVSLIVSWFGTDLRAAHCDLRPCVESGDKVTVPDVWSVAGVSRAAARVVSTSEGRPAYGGTPSDSSVVAAIVDLKARGLAVTFTPFVLMDIPVGNALPDPYGGSAQGAHPWRGRVTVDPAPGRPGSPDKTAAAATQLAGLIGTAAVSNYAVTGGSVVYSGPAEWSYRRLVLHYAHLCVAAGGVDTFVIGSELRGLTTVRSGASTYPFVAALVQLAADVKAVLGAATKVTYAADWSEYFGHQPADGSGDVYFHLDPLWASSAIDAIGIDAYFPLADWRDGQSHLDRVAGIQSPHDLGYLQGRIFAGEGYDWYYASEADRASQIRAPITDGSGKPWVFRFKDFRSWWQNAHFNRPGGVESTVPTAWVPRSKPVWLTELGCPAVDKGANQPNVFVDAKSIESSLPHFSRGIRDDLMQRRYLEAVHRFFDPGDEDFEEAANPVSPLYGGRMVPPDRITVYTWDARPYPAFPLSSDVWADGVNWQRGHWLNGRLAGGALPAVVAAILDDHGFSRYSVAGLSGSLDGYVIDRVMSARAALQPLELAFFCDSHESGGSVAFSHRGRRGPVATLAADRLVETDPDEPLYRLTRGQESELPQSAKLTFIDGDQAYRQAAAEARRTSSGSQRVSIADLPMVMGGAQAAGIAEAMLQDAWAARTRASFALPPSLLALEPTDLISLELGGREAAFRVTALNRRELIEVEALSIEPDVFEPSPIQLKGSSVATPDIYGPALALFLDLPLLGSGDAGHVGHVAAYASPWPGAIAFHRSVESSGFALKALATTQATLGTTATSLSAGPTGRIDRANRPIVHLDNGALQSVSELQMLGGANLAAIENADGGWEIFQFRLATLVAPATYQLAELLRGQAGSEAEMRNSVAAGARVVVLDAALAPVVMDRDELGLAYSWAYGPALHAIGHRSYRSQVFAFRGAGLKPLSPAHIRGRRAASGDLSLSWVRRTRIGGDSWETVDVPLGEEAEAYEVDILAGVTVKRTLAAATASTVYSAALQVADFGSLQPSILVRVHQLSPVYGRGAARSATV